MKAVASNLKSTGTRHDELLMDIAELTMELIHLSVPTADLLIIQEGARLGSKVAVVKHDLSNKKQVPK